MDCKASRRNFFKIILIVSVLFGSLLSFSGCGNDGKEETYKWSINVLESCSKSYLENYDSVRQYDGSVADVRHHIEPQNGKVFLLVNLNIKKNLEGNHSFVWKNLYLKDENNQTYKRIADVFLKDYKLKRIAATNLKLDANGWICFEIPQHVKSKNLNLIYVEDGQERVISLK